MIDYNSKNWFSIIFSLHKTHIFRVLTPSIFLVSIYSTACVYISKNIIHTEIKGSTVVHSLLGLVLGLLLVFRTNTAYDRWWEGRRLWGGLVNDSRNFAIKLNSYISENDTETRNIFAGLIANFCISLKDNLRNEIDINKLQNIDIDFLKVKKHIPNAVASQISNQITKLYKERIVSGEQLIILDKHLSSFTDITGACERIRNTPIPYSYNMHLKKYIFFYIITLPWGLLHDLGYISVIAVALVFYAMVGIELIGEEIEDPFGYDNDDLPLDRICQTIKTNIVEILNIN